jgi:hypothetical protein
MLWILPLVSGIYPWEAIGLNAIQRWEGFASLQGRSASSRSHREPSKREPGSEVPAPEYSLNKVHGGSKLRIG